jgi:hypothetical protein
MPVPGKTMMPIGRTASIASLRLNGAALATTRTETPSNWRTIVGLFPGTAAPREGRYRPESGPSDGWSGQGGASSISIY